MVVLYIFVMVELWNKWCGVCVQFLKTAFHIMTMELGQLNWNNSRILLRREARDESSLLHIVAVTCNVSVLRYAVTLQVCTHL
jgi:hypothetical protein